MDDVGEVEFWHPWNFHDEDVGGILVSWNVHERISPKHLTMIPKNSKNIFSWNVHAREKFMSF